MRKPRFTHHTRQILVSLFLVFFLSFNCIAGMQAHAMTHYVEAGSATPKPEALSLPQKIWTVFSGVTVLRPGNSHTPADVGLSYETRKIDAASGGYLEAWYVPQPQSRIVVLMFPGYAESKEGLLAQATALHDMGYSLLLVDFRGAGGSSGQDTTLGFREADDVATAANYARAQWPGSRMVLYGTSMGAAAIMRAVADEGVRPDDLILESPFNSLLDTASNRFHSAGLPAFASAQLLVFWGSVEGGYNGFSLNPSDYARSIDVPTLLIYGGKDPRVTPQQSKEIFANLRGRKEDVLFPEAGHHALISSDSALWQNRISTFLAMLP